MGNQEIEKRLESIENKLNEFINLQQSNYAGMNTEPISRDLFMRFYNRVRYDLPMSGFTPLVITLHSKYAQQLQKEILYPSDALPEHWCVTGEPTPVLITFADIEADYYIDSRIAGNLKDLI